MVSIIFPSCCYCSIHAHLHFPIHSRTPGSCWFCIHRQLLLLLLTRFTFTAPTTTSAITQLKFPSFNFANPSDPSNASNTSNPPSSQLPPLHQQSSSNKQPAKPEPVSASQPFTFPPVSSQPSPQFSNPPPSVPASPAGSTLQSTPAIIQNATTAIGEQSQIAAAPSVSANPSSQTFNFPSVQPPSSSSSPPVDKTFIAQKSFSALSTTPRAPSPLRHTVPAEHPPPTASPKTAFTQKDKDRLIHDFARVALLRPKGLIQHYIEFNLPDIVQSAFIQHHRDIHQAAVGKSYASRFIKIL